MGVITLDLCQLFPVYPVIWLVIVKSVQEIYVSETSIIADW